MVFFFVSVFFFFFQAEDGIRDLVRSRGLGDVYKRQIVLSLGFWVCFEILLSISTFWLIEGYGINFLRVQFCLLYTSDAADERSSVDLGGRRIIKKKTNEVYARCRYMYQIIQWQYART